MNQPNAILTIQTIGELNFFFKTKCTMTPKLDGVDINYQDKFTTADNSNCLYISQNKLILLKCESFSSKLFSAFSKGPEFFQDFLSQEEDEHLELPLSKEFYLCLSKTDPRLSVGHIKLKRYLLVLLAKDMTVNITENEISVELNCFGVVDNSKSSPNKLLITCKSYVSEDFITNFDDNKETIINEN